MHIFTVRLVQLFVVFVFVNKLLAASTNERSSDDDGPTIFEFTVPKDDYERSCLKMGASFTFDATYEVLNDKEEVINRTVSFTFDIVGLSYTGSCLVKKNLIEFQFLNSWRLELYFENQTKTYALNHIVLYYEFSGAMFPGSIHLGAHSETFNKEYFNASIGTSYRCDSGFQIDLHDVKINLTNVHLQPFFNKPPNFPFDSETKCPGDIPLTPMNKPSGIIWAIVIGSVLSLSIVVGIIVYVVRKIKQRTYEEVEQ